jgi:hypothetical protein
LQVKFVNLAGDPGVRDVDQNDLDGVIGHFVVAKATGHGHIINVNLARGALVRLRAADASMV